MSEVWKYATKRKDPITKQVSGQCNRCGDLIVCSDGSPSSLRNHLKAHGIIFGDTANNQACVMTEPPSKKVKTIDAFLKRKELHEIVADLATDGVSIRTITNNKFIRESIQRIGYKLPKSENDVMKILLEDFEMKKDLIINELKTKLEAGVKFSITMDEYSSVRRRRYISLNLHDSSKMYNTGIIRVFGSCPAEKMLEKVEEHLQSFGLSLDRDIVSSTLDGASVNKKFMSLTNLIGQFCLNHALHLGVCDTLYKRSNLSNEQELIEIDSEDLNDVDDFDGETVLDDNEDIEIEIVDYRDVLKNARKLVKFIKLSSVRNHIFQCKVTKEHEKEIELHLDVKHRWNSIISMIEPILKTKTCLFETFMELNAVDMINSVDFESLHSLQAALEPVKVAVEYIGGDSATLLTADTVLDFMLRKLDAQNTEISISLYNNLKRRISERFNQEVVDLMKVLRDPSIIASKNILNFAGKLSKRLFNVQIQDDEDSEIQNSDSMSENLSLQDELNLLLKSSESSQISQNMDVCKVLKQEFLLYRNTGKRSENLEKLFNALLTIKPTSTDVERVFSIATNFCTKIRSRLSDNSLNALIFLKFFYRKTSLKRAQSGHK